VLHKGSLLIIYEGTFEPGHTFSFIDDPKFTIVSSISFHPFELYAFGTPNPSAPSVYKFQTGIASYSTFPALFELQSPT